MSHYTDADVQAAMKASERTKWEVMRSILNGTPEADVREIVPRAVLDAVAPAIAARALREYADAMDRGERGGIDDWGIRSVYAVNIRTYADEIELGAL